jgi:urease accessory protein
MGWVLARGLAPIHTALAAVAAVAWEIPLAAAAHAYAWSWLENQVLAGVKLIPLGQVAGQRLLLQLSPSIPPVCERGLARPDDEIGGMLPIVALASSLHETQYTRLFRS